MIITTTSPRLPLLPLLKADCSEQRTSVYSIPGWHIKLRNNQTGASLSSKEAGCMH